MSDSRTDRAHSFGSRSTEERVGACLHILVMGVSGSGKTVVGAALAERLGVEFLEGDDHHPAENIQKMAAGIPLTDEDRWPWLRLLADLLSERHERGAGTVLACSALRRTYRDLLREAAPWEEWFVILLDADAATIRARLEHRRGHYMPPSLLDSQLATLEPLDSDETGIALDASRSELEVVSDALAAVRPGHGTLPPGR